MYSLTIMPDFLITESVTEAMEVMKNENNGKFQILVIIILKYVLGKILLIYQLCLPKEE